MLLEVMHDGATAALLRPPPPPEAGASMRASHAPSSRETSGLGGSRAVSSSPWSSADRMRRREEHLLHQDCVRGRGSSSGESDDQGDMRGVACEPKFETHWCPNRSALIPSIDVSGAQAVEGQSGRAERRHRPQETPMTKSAPPWTKRAGHALHGFRSRPAQIMSRAQ